MVRLALGHDPQATADTFGLADLGPAPERLGPVGFARAHLIDKADDRRALGFVGAAKGAKAGSVRAVSFRLAAGLQARHLLLEYRFADNCAAVGAQELFEFEFSI